MNRRKRSSHGNTVGLPSLTRFWRGFKVLLILAASLLLSHYLLVPIEEYIQDACKFTTAEEIG
jgi:hypothetical protein